jgi:hypothetical protein
MVQAGASQRLRLTGPAANKHLFFNHFETPQNPMVTSMRRIGSKSGAILYLSFAYSALARFRIGMSGSASFQSVRKS